MSKILGVRTLSGSIIPRWKLENPPWYDRDVTAAELRETERFTDFHDMCNALMVQGAFRHLRLNDPRKPSYDLISAIKKRIDMYDETRNVEFLCDVSNFAGLLFEEDKDPRKHFKQTQSLEEAHAVLQD